MQLIKTSTRRQFLKGLTTTALAPTLGLIAPTTVMARHQNNQQNLPPQIGMHLPIWHQGALKGEEFWPQVFNELKVTSINRANILIYHFVDPVTGKISNKSQYKNDQAPSLEFIEQGLIAGKQAEIEITLYPVLEIDNPYQIGSVWRGNLNFFGSTLKNFFHHYSKRIRSLASLAQKYDTPSIYLGSELASLTHNIAAIPYWQELIYKLRRKSSSNSHLLYAAHWEEYLTVPFWRQLDEIGVNAYFPLATPKQAAGIGEPSQAILKSSIEQHLKNLKNFASEHNRPLQLSEFGLTPYDQASAKPWDISPTDIIDTGEQLNAYGALLQYINEEGSNLSSVNFWHWQMPKHGTSNYNIAANSPLANLIKAHIENTTQAQSQRGR